MLFASSIAWRTASLAVSDPSVPTTIEPNIRLLSQVPSTATHHMPVPAPGVDACGECHTTGGTARRMRRPPTDRRYQSFTAAMTMPATTKTTIAACIQIHDGDIV